MSDSLDLDTPKEECGVVAVSVPGKQANKTAFFSVYALQHRGQEAAGIAVSDGRAIRLHKGQGLVSQVFKENKLEPLVGDLAIAHSRYSTCLLYTSPSPRDRQKSRMPSSA